MNRLLPPMLAGLLAVVAADAVANDDLHRVEIEPVEARRWIGAAWQPSRLQDWRIEQGRLVNDDGRLPVRTSHVLDGRLDPDAPTAAIVLETTIRPVGDGPLEPDAFAGILIGAGGPDVDPRLTSIVQQVPAPDGGLLAVMDGTRSPALLDFSTPRAGGFSWTLPRDTSMETLEPVPGRRVLDNSAATTGAVTLRIFITPRPGDRFPTFDSSSGGRHRARWLRLAGFPGPHHGGLPVCIGGGERPASVGR